MGYMNEFPHSRMFDSDLREILELFNNVKQIPNTIEEMQETLNQFINGSALQNAVNNKIDEMAENGELEKSVKSYTFTPFRVVNTLNSDEPNIGLCKGEYYIEKDTIINSNLLIANGAKIIIKEGANLIINGSIIAGRYQIFYGNLNISLSNGLLYPEWFDSNKTELGIKAAINAIRRGEVSLNGIYTVNNPITLSKDGVYMIGCGNVILKHTPNTCLYVGTQTNEILTNNTSFMKVENITFEYTGLIPYTNNEKDATIFVKGCGRTTIRNCRCVGKAQFFYLCNTVNILLSECVVDCAQSKTSESVNVIVCDNRNGLANMSLKIEKIIAHLGAIIATHYCRGIYMVGTDNRDAMILDCEFDAVDEAIRIYTDPNGLCYDITIENLISDLYNSSAIYMENCNKGQITIKGCWVSGYNWREPSTPAGVLAVNSKNISIIGLQTQNNASNANFGVHFENCEACSISSGIFYGNQRGILLNNCKLITVNGNTFTREEGVSNPEYAIKLENTQKTIISNNAISSMQKLEVGIVTVNSISNYFIANLCGDDSAIKEQDISDGNTVFSSGDIISIGYVQINAQNNPTELNAPDIDGYKFLMWTSFSPTGWVGSAYAEVPTSQNTRVFVPDIFDGGLLNCYCLYQKKLQ